MQRVTLKSEISSKPRAADLTLVEAERPACPDGGVLVRTLWLSLDPYVGSRLRGRHMGEPAPKPMAEPIPGSILGRVVESRANDVREGDLVFSMEGGWQDYCALPPGHFRRVEPAPGVPLSAYVGVLGMPGLTGWAGITQLAKVTSDDTVLIDAAAGPVGGTAGQIARIAGARVVGIAGGADKCQLVTGTYGFDACIDYKSDGWKDALKAALPDGLSVFFENVSADMAMFALTHARPYTRGVLCGLVDAYHSTTPSQHPINAGLVIGKRAQLHGLVVYDFFPRFDEFIAEVAPHIASGPLRLAEDRADSLSAAPALFEKLMDGRNVGKAVVQVSPEDAS